MATKKTSKSAMKKVSKPLEKRFIVRSAQEAVTQVREVLGPDAQVISVRQVKGSGLQRFLAAPRLEIVARAANAESKGSPLQPLEEKHATGKERPAESPELDQKQAEEVAGSMPTEKKGSNDAVSEEGNSAQAMRNEHLLEARLKNSSVDAMKCGQFLSRAGFSDLVLSRLSSQEAWREICELPLKEGLTKAIFHLREDRKRRNLPALSQRVAFVGGAGCGKTTALCKMLARDTFIRNISPQVLRIEADKPHMDDGLPLYCDVLGIRCCRSESELEPDAEGPVYIDVPGYSLTESGEINRMKKVLDEVDASSRILVMNAAYESSILRRFLETGDRLGAQFQILSHVDELTAFGKLWEHLMDTKRQLISFSNGQNVASDLIEDPFGFLLERTFPR